MKRTVLTALLMTLVLAFGTVTSYGTIDDKDAYGYTIKVYSGDQGHFGSNKSTTQKTIKCAPGEKVTLSISSLDLKLDNKEYYIRGFREAGHDNDEMAQSLAITVDQDMSYEVAYGLKGGMVSYVVNYVDRSTGEELLASDTYYGMKGDKPVVAYKYVEGYQPQAYNLGKTLSADESANVFDFKYTKVSGATADAGTTGDGAANNGGTNNGAGANGTAGAGAAGDGATAAAGNGTAGDGNGADGDGAAANNGPAQYADLDDGDVPLADPDAQDEASGGSSLLPILAGCGAGILAILAVIAILLRRRQS